MEKFLLSFCIFLFDVFDWTNKCNGRYVLRRTNLLWGWDKLNLTKKQKSSYIIKLVSKYTYDVVPKQNLNCNIQLVYKHTNAIVPKQNSKYIIQLVSEFIFIMKLKYRSQTVLYKFFNIPLLLYQNRSQTILHNLFLNILVLPK